MNRIYRIIWNKTLKTWVVASELSTGKKKRSVSATTLSLALLLASAAVAADELQPTAIAQEVTECVTAAQMDTQDESGNSVCVDEELLREAGDFPPSSKQSTNAEADSYFDANGAAGGGGVAVASGVGDIAIGSSASTSATAAIAIGQDAAAQSPNSIALGRSASVRFSKELGQMVGDFTGAIALGEGAQVFSEDQNGGAYGAIAVGMKSAATGDSAVALGNEATANAKDALALGANAQVIGESGVAIGTSAHVEAEFSVAIGASSVATEEYTVSFGDEFDQRRLVNVSRGRADTDAATMAQLRDVATAIGNGADFNLDKGVFTEPSFIVGDGTIVHTIGEAYNDISDRVEILENNGGGGVGGGDSLIADDDSVISVAAKSDTDRVDFSGVDSKGTPITRVLTGVADGAAPNDAVNFGQLDAQNTALTEAMAQSRGEIDHELGTQNAAINVNADAIAHMDDVLNNSNTGLVTQVAAHQSDIEKLNQELADVVGDGGDSLIADDDSVISVAAKSDTDRVDFSGVDSKGTPITRVLTGVADGAAPNDAVNFGQLTKTNENVDALKDRVEQLETEDSGSGSSLISESQQGDQINVGSQSNAMQINFANGDQARLLTGIAAGSIAKGSTDAVNGEQISQIREELQEQIGDLDDRVSSVETSNGGVSPPPEPEPEQPNDHVSEQHLEEQLQQVKDYNDSHYESLTGSIEALRGEMNDRFEETDRRIDRMGAMASASSMMSSSMSAVRGASKIAAGIGGQGSERAISVGYQRVIESTNASITVGGAYSGGETQMGVGFGFGW